MDINFCRFASNKLITIALTVAMVGSVNAGTKVVTFGWEDGTSTSLGEFIAGGSAGVSYANVTTGSEVDYGPTATPFIPPVSYTVAPIEGSRMLQVTVDPVDEGDSDAVVPYLGHLQNLDNGDIVQYSFKAYDPSDGRSPSVLANGVYGNDSSDINSFAGFFTPFQCFSQGTGWLDSIADAACDDVSFPVDPDLVFDVGTDRESVTLRAQMFRPTLSTLGSGGSGSYNFFIDDLRISVTSDNPDASITLPDGSITMVNGNVDVDGDFDDNGLYECSDVDGLVDEIVQVAGGASPNLDFDITSDGEVNDADLTAWLAEAGAAMGFAGPLLPGDADLDGFVNGGDFLIWNENKFTSDALWCGGDFNADGFTNGGDFLIWNENKFTDSGVLAVPEPAAGLLCLLGLAMAFRRR